MLDFPHARSDTQGMSGRNLITPFRSHYGHCRQLDAQGQIQECVAYLENPEVLITEFLESYHLVEREWDPETHFTPRWDDSGEELLLESFYASLELCVTESADRVRRVRCTSGALNPLGARVNGDVACGGLEYVGLRGEPPPTVILGVAETAEEPSPYLALLRALNCFAELAPPFQVIRLAGDVLKQHLGPETRFDLQLVHKVRQPSAERVMLSQLTRDLASVFTLALHDTPQFAEILGGIESVRRDSDLEFVECVLALEWRV
jgi:hypothetical protein